MFQTSPGPSSGGITVEVINKIDEIYWEYCAPSWFHLQDYIEMPSNKTMCPEVDSASENEYQGFLLG